MFDVMAIDGHDRVPAVVDACQRSAKIGAVDSADSLVSMLGTGTVVTWQANDHGSYLSGNACVGTAVHGYLIDLTAPASGLTCAG